MIVQRILFSVQSAVNIAKVKWGHLGGKNDIYTRGGVPEVYKTNPPRPLCGHPSQEGNLNTKLRWCVKNKDNGVDTRDGGNEVYI